MENALYNNKMATNNSINNLKRQRAFAWAKYYEQVAQTLDDNRTTYLSYQNVSEGGEPLPKHFTDWVEGLMIELKKKIECPVCLDIIGEGKLKISNCGHNYCSDCFVKLDKCAICRKKIYKK